MGVDGYLLTREWPLYAFDTLLMLAVQVIYLAWFPDKFRYRRAEGEEKGYALVEGKPRTVWRRYFDKSLRVVRWR